MPQRSASSAGVAGSGPAAANRPNSTAANNVLEIM
jgi:hypothetical protein